MSDENRTVVKKVKPYPFAAELEHNSIKKPVFVAYMNQTGVVVRLDKSLVQVGEYYQIHFQIPVMHHVVVAQIRVVKTYDHASDPRAAHVDRMAELHFQNLPKPALLAISQFLVAIGQAR